jgi:hypothetical protein
VDAPSVVKAGQIIEFDRIADASGNPPPFTLQARSSSGLPVQFQIVHGPATIDGSMLAITGAGTVTVRAVQPGDDRHAAALPVERTFTVAPAPSSERIATPAAERTATLPSERAAPLPPERAVTPPSERTTTEVPLASSSFVERKFQSITVESIRNRPIGSAPFKVMAQSSSKLPLGVFVVGGPATLQGETLTLNGAGTVTLRFVQAGNNEFLPANPVETSFVVEGGKKVEAPPARKVADAPISIAPAMVDPVVGHDYFLRFSLYHERNKHPTTNYARGTLVPINTPVKFVSMSKDIIVLRRSDTGEELKVENVQKFSKKSLVQIARIMLSEEKTPLDKLPGKLAGAIRSGQLIRGMTKEQVLMARGYPPAHETPSLDGDRWTYWSSRFANHAIVFVEGRLADGRGVLAP